MSASLDGQVMPGLDEVTQAVVASVPQGNQLRGFAAQLAIPVNQGVGGPLVLAPEQGRLTVSVGDGLTFTVLSPHKASSIALNWSGTSQRRSIRRTRLPKPPTI